MIIIDNSNKYAKDLGQLVLAKKCHIRTIGPRRNFILGQLLVPGLKVEHKLFFYH